MSPKYKLLHAANATPLTNDTPPRSAVYVAAQFKDAKPPTGDDCTLYHLFAASCEKFASQDCLGERVVDADGEAGDYAFWTYQETAERVEHVASALAAAGIKKGAKVGVYGINCREWMLAMQACNRMSYVCVPVYDTLGENAVEYIISHSESTVVFLNGAKMDKMAGGLAKVTGYNGPVIYWGHAEESAIAKIRDMNLTVYSFEEFMKLGKEQPAPPDPPKPTDLCTIMYTSGTTGDPKGVMLEHRSVVAGVNALRTYVAHYLPDGIGERFLSFLPLAHIFDQMAEEMNLALGVSIGYWQGEQQKLVSDIAALKPTIFCGVPRVFERIYNRLQEVVQSSGFVKRTLFRWGYARKSQAMREGISQAKASPFFDRLVFSKSKARLGGQVKLIITGGAPIAAHVEEFLRVCFCTDVVQGYGLTETCACGFLQIPDDPTMSGTVGPCVPYTELCLESVEDMNCDATGENPAGEVCIRSPFNFTGYYEREDLTNEVVDKDGWFHTGDVGIITSEGALKLVDRKKNIIKLSQGEYVALEKVENCYKEADCVDQIWVYGDSFMNYIVAIVVPTEAYVKQWAASQGREFDYAALCNDPVLTKEILDALTVKARKELKGFEVVKKLKLESEPFAVENDLLTPTFKLKRTQLKQKYEAITSDLYSS